MIFQEKNGLLVPLVEQPKPKIPFSVVDDFLIEVPNDEGTGWEYVAKSRFGSFVKSSEVPSDQGFSLLEGLQYVQDNKLCNFKLSHISREVKT